MNRPGDGKLDFTLVPPALLEQVTRVMMFGAVKYSRDGWKTVPDAKHQYHAACLRHMHAYAKGEALDHESGLPHLAHAAACLAILLALADESKLPERAQSFLNSNNLRLNERG